MSAFKLFMVVLSTQLIILLYPAKGTHLQHVLITTVKSQLAIVMCNASEGEECHDWWTSFLGLSLSKDHPQELLAGDHW